MADNSIVQTIQDAEIDARSLSEFISKDASFMVARRLAPSVHTLDYYLSFFDIETSRVGARSDSAIQEINNKMVAANAQFAASENLLGSVNTKYNEAIDTVNSIEPTIISMTNNAINNTALEDSVLSDTFVNATSYHSDTYARTQKSKNADTVSLLDFIPPNLHEGILSYAYTDDVKQYVQKAVDYSVANNKKLYAPSGGYLLDNKDNTAIRLDNIMGGDRNFHLMGDGKGLTVFKEADKSTEIAGRYTRMFYFYYGSASNSGSFGHIRISGITFDKNARSNENLKVSAKLEAGQPVLQGDLYFYEQSHIFFIGGAGSVSIESVTLDDVEFKDRTGGGFTFSGRKGFGIKKVLINDMLSTYNPRGTHNGDGTFGSRACIEYGGKIDCFDIANSSLEYIQCEPETASAADSSPRLSITGGSIDVVEFTDKSNYNILNVSNLMCFDKFLLRGVNANISNSITKVNDVYAGGVVKFNGGTILLDYDASTNAVRTFMQGIPSGYDFYGELWLSNLEIKIDSPDPNITPTGYGISGGGSGKQGDRLRVLNNVRFDKRLEASIQAYGNSDWKIVNCDLYGRTHHVKTGGFSIYGGDVELTNNNYLGSGVALEVNANNSLFTLSVTGDYNYVNFYQSKGATDYSPLMKRLPTLRHDSMPASDGYPRGQVVINKNITQGQAQSWVKTGGTYPATASWQPLNVVGSAGV